jgi:hypothetical protein
MNVCNIVAPRTAFRAADSANLYRPPPPRPPSKALIESMKCLSVETVARDRLNKFYFTIFSGSHSTWSVTKSSTEYQSSK